MGQAGFWAPFLAFLGPFPTPLGLSLGPNVYILIILGVPKLLRTQCKVNWGPQKGHFEQKYISEKNTFLTPNLAFFAHKMGQNWVHWGVHRANFRFLRVPDHLGTDKKMILSNFFWQKHVFFLPQIGPKCPQNGPKWGQLGGLQGQFWVFEGPGPFGGRNNAFF